MENIINMRKSILLFIPFFIAGCAFFVDSNISTNNEKGYKIYPEHLDYLCENVVLPNEKESLLTHIYCEAPNYDYTPAPGEGISCIDDVARAGVFFLDYYNNTHNEVYFDRVKRCAEFVLYLHQTDKNAPGFGYFYNFVDRKNGKLVINRDGVTSKAEPNWWTWRAMWFLGYIYTEIDQRDPKLATRIKSALDLTFAIFCNDFSFEGNVKTEKGIAYADWLPNTASDQSAIILMSLIDYVKIAPESREKIVTVMNRLADGLLIGQIKDEKSDVNGALLCWKNSWHGWGNNIAYSLLLAGKYLNNKKYIDAALLEVDNFQKYLIKIDYLKEFNVERTETNPVAIIPDSEKKFEQIAYAMRPMVYASLEAYVITKDKKYLDQAETLSDWFFGKNPAKVVMYNPEPDLRKGLVFDGINSFDSWNKNSGAESTIEALLSLQKLKAFKNNKITY